MRSHPVKDGSTLGDVTMAVDRGYGSGYKNSGLSKSSALKPGRLKKTAPAVAKARTLQSRNDAASPSTARDKRNPKTVKALKRGARDLSNALFGTGQINGQPVMESGVSGFKVIAGALAKVASNAAKSGNVKAFEEAMSLSRTAGLAAKFPKSPGAKKVINELKQTMIRHQSQGGGRGVPRGVLDRSGYTIPREESIVIARGAAKVIGKSAGGDQGVIALGKEFGKIAKQPKTPYFNKETNRFVNPEAGPYQVRASSTGKVDLKDNIVRGYPVGGPNADRISRISRESQEELIRRNIQRDIAKKQRDIKKRGR